MVSRLEAVWWRIDALLWGTDMKATRFTLAVAAVFTALTLWLHPTYWPDGYLSASVAAALFALQGLVMGGTLLLGGRHQSWVLYADGVLGCLLWSYVCATNLSYDPWHYSDAAHIAIALASWWSLVRWGDTADAD